MFTNKLDGDPIFGRIYELDLECPGCGEVWYLNSIGRGGSNVPGRRRGKWFGPYNFRTGRFTCPSCGQTFGLGLYLWPIEDRHGEEPPADWIPTYRQAMALRMQTTAQVGPFAKRWKDQANTVVREGCTCRIRGMSINRGDRPGGAWGDGPPKPFKKPYKTRFIVNKDCPIHGSWANEREEKENR